MRKQIAAANWKMNLTYQQAEKLLDELLQERIRLETHQEVIFAIPFPYMIMARSEVADEKNYFIAAQNCHQKQKGAFTGEISAEMLHSIRVPYCIVGHSERREYFLETDAIIGEKIDRCQENFIIPIFCCGEPLGVREEGRQNEHVSSQIEKSLFHLKEDKISTIVIAYEPVWAIGTGKTATSAQAQEMHAHIRSVIAGKFGPAVANKIPIVYGGSVKGSNAKEIFECPDVDGGLVGGASLVATEFNQIIKALK
jgi:triosephosphate isomerase (TIM)